MARGDDVTTSNQAGQRYNPGPILGRVLAYGSRVSIVALALGLALTLAHGERGGKGMRPDAIATALQHGNTIAILGLGIAVLIATPILREVTALVLFLRHRDRTFAAIAATVLALVLVSVVIGSR
jgi:uncharacterized membrane protein